MFNTGTARLVRVFSSVLSWTLGATIKQTTVQVLERLTTKILFYWLLSSTVTQTNVKSLGAMGPKLLPEEEWSQYKKHLHCLHPSSQRECLLTCFPATSSSVQLSLSLRGQQQATLQPHKQSSGGYSRKEFQQILNPELWVDLPCEVKLWV